MKFDKKTLNLAEQVLDVCRNKKILLATAESCTGGLVMGALTEIPGSSDVVDRGFITYSNTAKAKMLGINPDLIAKHGAVSHEVAIAMANGAVNSSDATVAVSTTGIAGPGGGSPEKPVGLVCFAVSNREGYYHEKKNFGQLSRNSIRIESVNYALQMVFDFLEKPMLAQMAWSNSQH